MNDQPPLPPNIEMVIDSRTGHPYYIDHVNKTTSWERPTVAPRRNESINIPITHGANKEGGSNAGGQNLIREGQNGNEAVLPPAPTPVGWNIPISHEQQKQSQQMPVHQETATASPSTDHVRATAEARKARGAEQPFADHVRTTADGRKVVDNRAKGAASPRSHKSPPQQQQQPPTMTEREKHLMTIFEVSMVVEDLKGKVDEFSGTSRSDKEYRRLEESLTQQMLKLDGVTADDDEVRLQRKECIRSIQKCLDALETKVS